MKTGAATRRIIGCIGKCTTGLSVEELDLITDNIHKTLNHHQGRKVFREFLRKGKRQDELKCLDFHQQCCRSIENDRNYVVSAVDPNLRSLTNDFSEAFDIAVELDGVPQIDMDILDKFNEALNTPCREEMVQLLEEMKSRLEEHLSNAHVEFKRYIVEPCPKTSR